MLLRSTTSTEPVWGKSPAVAVREWDPPSPTTRRWLGLHLTAVAFLFFSTSAITMLADEVAPNSNRSQPPRVNHPRDVASFTDLEAFAKQLSQKPYAAKPPLSAALASLSYEDYREISYRHPRATWANQHVPFWLETFHRGFIQRSEVQLFTLDEGNVRPIPFSTDDFEYPSESFAEVVPADAGHAGLKIAGRFPGREDSEEMLTFLGSSYFRSRSAETIYGASARGLAVDIAMNQDEEFPAFETFWVVKPEPSAEQLTAFALLDSRSVVGAYRFTFRPGTTESRLRVHATLYFRSTPGKIGIAPLTSMWIWGDGLKGPPLDSRPAVHDSDGLLIRTEKDEWIWRAFARQSYPSTSRLETEGIKGFGLLQRNRAFFHFNDYNANYHKRPSIWITTQEPWRNGHIELLELPGAHEGVDNIAAYWVPASLPAPGQPMSLRYDVAFFAGDYAQQRNVARATSFDLKRRRDTVEMTIRFSGSSLSKRLPIDSLHIDSSAIRARITRHELAPTSSGDWLATLVLEPTETAPFELRVTLMQGERPISETFSYLCPLTRPEFMYPQVYTRKD